MIKFPPRKGAIEKKEEKKKMKRFYVVYHVRFMSEPLQKFDDLFKAIKHIELMATGGYALNDFCVRIEEVKA